MVNIITATDSYKFGAHWNMYPQDTEYVYSYFEAREGARFRLTPFFGLQYILREYLDGEVIEPKHIDAARRLSKAHLGSESAFNEKGWRHIVEKHGGLLPLRIKAVPEGLPVPTGNVLMTVENTDPEVPWLTNYVESILSHVWYPSTVCALSRRVKELILDHLQASADGLAGLNFMLHDFGYRGVSTHEGAMIGGAAHLVNFLGTDTLPAMECAMEYYGASIDGLAYSVPASEHSVMTALGPDGEAEILQSLLHRYPSGILSVVADSYDIYNFVERLICEQFRERILARDGVFVVRPDSVSPIHRTPAAQVLWIVETLANKMGYTTNSKGFMVLNPKVRVLWGDGLELEAIDNILGTLVEARFSAENIATFGMGGGLLQKVNRDTQRFAFKSSAQCRGGQWYDIYKKPKDLSKMSKRGRLKLVQRDGEFRTVPESAPGVDLLETVFENGEIAKYQNFAEIRQRAEIPIDWSQRELSAQPPENTYK